MLWWEYRIDFSYFRAAPKRSSSCARTAEDSRREQDDSADKFQDAVERDPNDPEWQKKQPYDRVEN